MRRTDADIIDARNDIRYLYRIKRRLNEIDQKLKELDAQLDNYGVSSPLIRSTEEAKYQRGTRIYSTENLMEIFTEQDTLDGERVLLMQVGSAIESRLVFCQLTEEEQKLLDYRYGHVPEMKYKEIARLMHCEPPTVLYHLYKIFDRYAKFL